MRGKRSEHWSFKCNKPGRRFHFVQDAKTNIVWKSDGYSPKFHDGQYVEALRPVFEAKFSGGHFVGDEHYAKLKGLMLDPTFDAPFRETAHLTAAQQKYNKDLRFLRGRVETPFGWLKQNFETLNHSWPGDLGQLDYLVTYASAAYNRRIV